MNFKKIKVKELTDTIQKQLEEETDLSSSLKKNLDTLFLVVNHMAERLGLNSSNSSKPPSSDPNRLKKPKKGKGNKPGGQKGRKGVNLKMVDNPDVIKDIPLDQSTLPEGQYVDGGYERRQVFDIEISRVVTEYRAQVLFNSKKQKFVAPFPDFISRPAQYGASVKVNSVYLSMLQLIPYMRIVEHFTQQWEVPLSAGSVFNFNQEAFDLLETFEDWLRIQIIQSHIVHFDETGINIGSKRCWLHCASNPFYSLFHPHEGRGRDAMDDMKILPQFKGIMCHDHWRSYYSYDNKHSYCNAHHLRELNRAWEMDNQQWAKKMIKLLIEIKKVVTKAGGCLDPPGQKKFRDKYQNLLLEADKECPAPDESKRKGKRGRLARSKSRNLLERLRDHEDGVLRFMTDKDVPFTNNLAEKDIRMTKVQQKISGCFRSFNGAKIFCRIRSYLSTCKKHNVSATEALTLLFDGKLPDFVKLSD